MGHFRPLLATRYTPNRGLFGLSRQSLHALKYLSARKRPSLIDPGPKVPRQVRHLPLVRHLKEPDFVALYALYLLARILRCLAARTMSHFLAGLHSLLALPKGDAD
jgi:hypothetical protein